MFIPKKFEQYIMQGKVLNSKGEWCTIDEAIEEEKELLYYIKHGYVHVDGSWVKVDTIPSENLSPPPVNEQHKVLSTHNRHEPAASQASPEEKESEETPTLPPPPPAAKVTLEPGQKKSAPKKQKPPSVKTIPVSDTAPPAAREEKPAPFHDTEKTEKSSALTESIAQKEISPFPVEQPPSPPAQIKSEAFENRKGFSAFKTITPLDTIQSIEDTVEIVLPKHLHPDTKEPLQKKPQEILAEQIRVLDQDTRFLHIDMLSAGNTAALSRETIGESKAEKPAQGPSPQKVQGHDDWYRMLDELNDAPELDIDTYKKPEPVQPVISADPIQEQEKQRGGKINMVFNSSRTAPLTERQNTPSPASENLPTMHLKPSSGINESEILDIALSSSKATQPPYKNEYKDQYTYFNDSIFTEWDNERKRTRKMYIIAGVGIITIIAASIILLSL